MKRATDLPRLDKEKVLTATELSDAEARFLVSDYYQFQEMRKRADMQIRHLGDKELPSLLRYTADSSAHMETQIVRGLQVYAESTKVGRWCLSHLGVGPVITAGLMAHLSLERAPTVGHWWRFAGLDPTCKWEEGQKRPWNAALKQICWHAGQCFKRVSHRDEAYYGGIYQARKKLVEERNERGYNAERAKTFYTKSKDVKAVLKQGKLPAGNLDQQACNYAAKIFLSHLHGIMWWDEHRSPPPKPFAIAHIGHAHLIRVPNTDMFPGFDDAYYGSSEGRSAA